MSDDYDRVIIIKLMKKSYDATTSPAKNHERCALPTNTTCWLADEEIEDEEHPLFMEL